MQINYRHFYTMTTILGGLMLLLSGLSTTVAADKETIRWHQMDYPPLYILEGPDKGKGAADILQQMLIERLGPKYQHSSIVVNDARSRHESKKGINACFVGGVYNDPDYYSSIPIAAVYPHMVVIKRGRKTQLTHQENTISLDALLGNRKLTLGLQKDRSRGEVLDTLIQKYKGEDNIRTSGLYSLTSLLKMILHDRIDYTIDYAYWVQHTIKQNGLEDQFDFIEIQENQGTIMRGGVVCTKNEWGKGVIKKIDRILVDIRPLPEYRKIFEDLGYIPQGFEKEYWEIYERAVLQIE